MFEGVRNTFTLVYILYNIHNNILRIYTESVNFFLIFPSAKNHKRRFVPNVELKHLSQNFNNSVVVYYTIMIQ